MYRFRRQASVDGAPLEHKSLDAAELRGLRAAGIANFNLDLIFGIPGSSDETWRKNLGTAFLLGVPHVSAYALIVEAGTGLARRIDRGEIARPDDDVAAHRYLIIDEVAALPKELAKVYRTLTA